MRCTDGQWLLIRLLSVSAQFYKYRWIPDDLKNWIVKKPAFYISLEKGKWLIGYKNHKPLFTPAYTHTHTNGNYVEVVDMLISLMVVIISQCICI